MSAIPQLFFTRTTPTGTDIFVGNLLPGGMFGPPTLVPELNSPLSDAGASVRSDGLEVFFFSRKDFDPHIDSSRETLCFTSPRAGGSGGQDVFVTTRAKRTAR